MTIEQLRRAHRAEPFKPFDICLADGQRFHVPHPEELLTTMPRTVIVACPPEAFQAIDVQRVIGLDFDVKKKRTPRRKGNGSNNKRG